MTSFRSLKEMLLDPSLIWQERRQREWLARSCIHGRKLDQPCRLCTATWAKPHLMLAASSDEPLHVRLVRI